MQKCLFKYQLEIALILFWTTVWIRESLEMPFYMHMYVWTQSILEMARITPLMMAFFLNPLTTRTAQTNMSIFVVIFARHCLPALAVTT